MEFETFFRAEFQAVRARLDPGGLFQNNYTLRTLGPVGSSDQERRAAHE
ncbi:hypothetical protein [Streptomyces sp. SID13031]|nr:hypothetical protein [Streptomyces sp. SID13031]NEA30263.1 hypothetical protein [Streptomyces sp. SID13031]